MTENRVKVWRAADLSDAEMLKGIYVRHSYPWHTHEDLCLGLVIGGAINLRTRARSGVASTGSFVLINSDEIHEGWPAANEGWKCRTIHVHPAAIQRVADEHRSFGRNSPVAFRGPTFNDPSLARRLLDLHRHSEGDGSSLERQSLIVGLISCLLSRHAETSVELHGRDNEPRAVTRARTFLDENLSDKVTLDNLAAVAELTPFRLLRSFRKAIGLTPHEYQLQARVRQAHERLRRREQLADIAAAVGFADQAHMTRVFKSIMGATPGQFRAASVASIG
jgi:AraC-like DNA-binding protein